MSSAEPQTSPQPRQDDPRIIQALEEYLGALEDEHRPSRSEFLARHPDIAVVLAQALDGLDFIEKAVPELRSPSEEGASAEEPPELHREDLGDFRIVREVARGGMGIVYEAVQLSLGRRVALKVLPFAATLDPRQLQRFKNEAQAAALLHHTNIVPVYFVGCERGVHFYAMQFIEGQSLAALIHEMRQFASRASQPAPERPEGPSPVEPTGPYASPTPTAGALSTERSARGPAYFRGVAQMGIQAAEALAHAHDLGVIHRDIKPGNLLVDGRGNVWVTDFGLAHCQSQASLTVTGDLVGTLRYMSPEQALARRVVVDHRTDVYSLGATLYELLTLQPAFTGSDRQELLRQIAFEEPLAPRRLDRAIPKELETIVLKALEKNPAERYAGAQELADDLRRFLEDRPILARRPSLLLRARKMARRNRALVGAVVVVLLALAVMLAGNWARLALQAAERAGAIKADCDRAEAHLGEKRLAEAEGALGSGEARAVAGAPEELRRRLRQLRADLDMARKLEAIPLAMMAERREVGKMASPQLVLLKSRPEHLRPYRQAFQDYGLDLEAMGAGPAAEIIRASLIREQLLGGLFFWFHQADGLVPDEAKRLEAVLAQADEDDWRRQLPKALKDRDVGALKRLADRPEASSQSPTTLALLAEGLWFSGAPDDAIRFLHRALRDHPDDPLLHANMGLCLTMVNPPRLAEAAGHFRVALAVRKDYSSGWMNLGITLHQVGDMPQAEAAYRKALEGHNDHAPLHQSLGVVLWQQGKHAEAEAAYRRALHHDPKLAEALAGLGVLLCARGQEAEGTRLYKQALKVKPELPEAHNNLGNVLYRKGKIAEARPYFEKALALRPAFPEALNNLGLVLRHEGKLGEAVRHYQLAVLFKPDYALAYLNLGRALAEQRKFSEAKDAYLKALQIQPDMVQAHGYLGDAAARDGRFLVAELAYRQFLRHRPNHAVVHHQLGLALLVQGKLPQAEAAFRKAGQLKPDYAQAHQNLGVVLLREWKWAEAEAAYRTSLKYEPHVAWCHDGLGEALAMQGKLAEAVKSYERAAALLPKDPAIRYHLHITKRRLALEPKFSALVRGEEKAPAGEEIVVVDLCISKRMFVSAVRLYQEVFAAVPRLAEHPNSPHRYKAACAAARAAAGEGEEAAALGAAERSRLRGQALAWLRADLSAARQRLEKGPDEARAAAYMRLAPMEHDPNLSSVRDARALARLPESERGEWRKFWADVAAQLAKALGGKK
jgi:serine/threonine protein kinase/Flp pilus assembly protein TadD